MNILGLRNYPTPIKQPDTVILSSAEEYAKFLAGSIYGALKVKINPLEVHLLLRLCAKQMNWKVNDGHKDFKTLEYFEVKPNRVGYLLKELRISGVNEMNKVIAALPTVESYIKDLLQQQFAVRPVNDVAVLTFLEDKKTAKPPLLTQDLIRSTILEIRLRLNLKMG